MRIGAVLALVTASLLAAAPAWAHPEPNDVDGDNVLNVNDNCVNVWNFDQADDDGDDVGDRCDEDYDRDGDGAAPEWDFPGNTTGRWDNCPTIFNRDQADEDGDGVGDACDVDTDRDQTADVFDNCPTIPNFGQNNIDRDPQGDACDPDIDGDLLANGRDNCADVYNPDQRDDDRDGLGFLCDADDTPASGSPGGPGGGSGGVADRTRPRLRIVGGLGGFLRADLRSGLPVGVRCSEACAVRARLAAGRRTLARGTATLAGPGRTYVFLRAGRKARRWLARRPRVRATLHLTAVDRAGNVRRVRRAMRLR